MKTFEQHRQEIKYDLEKEPELTFTKVHKEFMLRGRKVTRKQIRTGKPIAYHANCERCTIPTYYLYKDEVFFVDKGYIEFIAESLDQFIEMVKTGSKRFVKFAERIPKPHY